MNLITISNNVAVPSAYTLTIIEFKNLNTKELAYVYFMCDHHSPFSVYDEDKRHEEVCLSVFGKTDWKATDKVKIPFTDRSLRSNLYRGLSTTRGTDKVKVACDKYKKLKETSAVRLLKAARESVVKLEKYFKTIDLTLVDDNGKPIFAAKDLVANLSKMGDVVNGLTKLEDLVKKEEQVKTGNRGGVEVNKYSQ